MEKWPPALDMLDETRSWGLEVPLAVADVGYGDTAAFRHGLQERGLPYVVVGLRHAVGVERATRYVMLVHLAAGQSAIATRNALAATVQTLPPHLWRSLTWDQGSEMAAHRAFTVATDIPVYFCAPASP